MIIRIALVGAGLMLNPPMARAATLNITVQNVQVDKGEIIVCLWKDGQGFPDCDKHLPFEKRKLPARSATLNVSFDGIADGTYAVSVAQDLNNNGRVDSNFIGIPKEPVAVSNNAKGTFGAPRFGAASFVVSNTKAITVKL